VRLLYTALFYAALPLILLRLLWKGRALPGYRSRISERFGFYTDQIGPIDIWFHAVSVGESEALFPIVKSLLARKADLKILVTSTTPTGSSRITSVLGDSVQHVYLPYDIPLAIKRFLRRFDPRIGVILETEIWPNLYLTMKEQGRELLIINGRLSDKSMRGYRKLGALARSCLEALTLVAAQTKDDAQRYIAVGANPNTVVALGNVKFDIVFDEALQAASRTIRHEILGNRFTWIAGSTHPGEDELILESYISARRRVIGLLLVLAPRHPERSDDIERLCESRGLRVARRSEKGSCGPETDVFLLDTIGELRTFYGASNIAFVAGSLVPHGGQNVLEPAVAGTPVVFGPYVHNFREITSKLLEAGGAIQIQNTLELTAIVEQLHKDIDLSETISQNARDYVERNRGAVQRITDLLVSQIDNPSSK